MSDQRTASTYIFGAICPQQGKGAGLVLPSCNTEAMSLHLAEIATATAGGRMFCEKYGAVQAAESSVIRDLPNRY